MQDGADPAKVDARNEKQMAMGNPKFILGLTQMAMRGMLPTPCARDYKGDRKLTDGENMTKKGQVLNMTLEQTARVMTDTQEMSGKTSQLNPPFVAEMMGFPPNWTESPFLSGETKV
jgi:hypothetical protein